MLEPLGVDEATFAVYHALLSHPDSTPEQIAALLNRSVPEVHEVLNRLQVVPLTSKVGRLYPAEAYVTLNGEQRKAMADQLTTISKVRLRERLGKLGAEDMQEVARIIRLQLGFD